MENEDREFKRIGQIANANGGQVMNISADGHSILLHFDFDNNQNIHRFMKHLETENIRIIASASINNSCKVLM